MCARESARRFQTHGYWIRKCAACGHEFAELLRAEGHVDRVYGDGYFSGGEAGYSNYLAEEKLLRAAGRRYARLLAAHRPPGRLLDVGCAAGFVLSGFVDEGWSGVGVEPNASMVAHGRAAGLDLRVGTLETVDEPGGFDLISIVQVMAHFVSPMDALAAAARLTRPGGYWLIETWNRESWTRRLFGEKWHEYSPPSVLQWFSPESLTTAAARFGMELAARGRPAKWLHSDHAAELVRHKLAGGPLEPVARMATKLIPRGLPIPYPAEDLFWVLYRRV